MRSRIVRRDILEELQDVINNDMRPGTADSDVNVYDIDYPIRYGLLRRIKIEIENLRTKLKAEGK